MLIKVNVLKKVSVSNKIYPYYAGISDDLLFWASINTIFLTTVKHFSLSQISMLSAIAVFFTIIVQNLIFRIIKKVGNLSSVRIGLIGLLLSAVIMTVSNSFWITAAGFCIYEISFFFKKMDNIILKRNLNFLKQGDQFVGIQAKVSMIYAIITAFLSAIAGMLFNLYVYLPMILCICICLVNLVLSFFLYEAPYHEEVCGKKVSFQWTEILFFIVLLFGIFYGTIDIAQENGQLFLQYYLQDYVSLDQVSIYLSVILTVSRISRIFSNVVFEPIYKKLKNKILLLLNFLSIMAVAFMLIGNLLNMQSGGFILMGLGFSMILFIRDPVMIFFKNALLNHCSYSMQQQAMQYYNLSRQVVKGILAILGSIILIQIELSFFMFLLMLLFVICVLISVKLYILLEHS